MPGTVVGTADMEEQTRRKEAPERFALQGCPAAVSSGAHVGDIDASTRYVLVRGKNRR